MIRVMKREPTSPVIWMIWSELVAVAATEMLKSQSDLPWAFYLSGNINKVATVTNHFSSWPSNKPLITDAKSTDLV
jgi:hypothetical protein